MRKKRSLQQGIINELIHNSIRTLIDVFFESNKLNHNEIGIINTEIFQIEEIIFIIIFVKNIQVLNDEIINSLKDYLIQTSEMNIHLLIKKFKLPMDYNITLN